MSLKTIKHPLEALEIFYEGEKLGVWEGDLIRNERKRGLYLPLLLKEFLLQYGLFSVNYGENQLWLPDKIDQDKAKVDGELKDILIVGKFHDSLAAILADECGQENPFLLLDDLPEEDGEDVVLVFHKSKLSLEDFLSIMLIESPPVYDNAKVYHGEDGLGEVLAELDEDSRAELKRQVDFAERPTRVLYWDKEKRNFLALNLTEQDIIVLKFPPCLTIRELENLFTREFYENADNCDFEHALKLLTSLINYWSQVNDAGAILAEKYKLAGRCCWALKRWAEAERYYKQAEDFYKDILANILDKTISFYEGMGNFYLAREDIFKSQGAFLEVDRLCEFAGKNGPRSKGERIMRQGIIMSEATRYDKAIEFYDMALAEFQKDPKDCKYDIARCQQLRGEARKKLKAKDQQERDDKKSE